MAHSTRRRSSRRRRNVYDFLRKQHQDYLGRERQSFMSVDRVLWYLRHAPYPVDADTAAAIKCAVSHFVLSGSRLRFEVEDWVLPEFEKELRALHADAFGISRELPRAVLEDNHFFVFSCDDGPPYGDFARNFVKRCDEVRDTALDLARETGVLTSTCVSTPYLPFGNPRHEFPLIDHVWIDRRFLELVEACALLHEKGFVRLPAIDPHPLAWHRFFPPKTRWREPRADPGAFQQAQSEVQKMMNRQRWRRRELDGRPFVHFDDYHAWQGRATCACEGFQREVGLILHRWNECIPAEYPEGREQHLDIPLRTVSPLFAYTEGRDFVIDSGQVRNERDKALEALQRLANKLPSPNGVLDSPLQIRIQERLSGRVMTADTLAHEVGCDTRTLFKPGGLSELCERGTVVNDKRVGGYYMPERPPESLFLKTRALSGH